MYGQVKYVDLKMDMTPNVICVHIIVGNNVPSLKHKIVGFGEVFIVGPFVFLSEVLSSLWIWTPVSFYQLFWSVQFQSQVDKANMLGLPMEWVNIQGCPDSCSHYLLSCHKTAAVMEVEIWSSSEKYIYVQLSAAVMKVHSFSHPLLSTFQKILCTGKPAANKHVHVELNYLFSSETYFSIWNPHLAWRGRLQ